MAQENGDAKLLRPVIDLQENYTSMQTKLDVLISLGQCNQAELRINYTELNNKTDGLTKKIDAVCANINEIKELIKGKGE